MRAIVMLVALSVALAPGGAVAASGGAVVAPGLAYRVSVGGWSGVFQAVDGFGAVEAAGRPHGLTALGPVGRNADGSVVTLKWPVSCDPGLLGWLRQGPSPSPRRDVTIALADGQGRAEATWRLSQCWPEHLQLPAAQAGSAGLASLQVQLRCEAITRTR